MGATGKHWKWGSTTVAGRTIGKQAPRPGRYFLDAPINGELVRISGRLDALRHDRDALLARGQKGDVSALVELYERWRVRLPLVEGRLQVTLPWMTGSGSEVGDQRSEIRADR